MNTTVYKVRLTFTTSVLGTQPQKDVATEYIASKAEGGVPPEDELATLQEQLQKGTTAFHRLDGKPIYYDYMIKGFLKEAGGAFNGLRNVKALKNKITNFVFVTPRQILLHVPPDWTPSVETLKDNPDAITDYCERPLRAETAQGPRTALARSEELPAGTWMDVVFTVFNSSPITEEILADLLAYGAYKGLGQWRNGGHGSFLYTLEKQ